MGTTFECSFGIKTHCACKRHTTLLKRKLEDKGKEVGDDKGKATDKDKGKYVDKGKDTSERVTGGQRQGW